jgi:hypothetical protein
VKLKALSVYRLNICQGFVFPLRSNMADRRMTQKPTLWPVASSAMPCAAQTWPTRASRAIEASLPPVLRYSALFSREKNVQIVLAAS